MIFPVKPPFLTGIAGVIATFDDTKRGFVADTRRLLLQRIGDVPNDFIHDHDHGGMLPTASVFQVQVIWINGMLIFHRLDAAKAFVVCHEVKLLIVLFRYLERAVSHMRGIEQKQRISWIMGLNDVQKLFLVEKLRVVRSIDI